MEPQELEEEILARTLAGDDNFEICADLKLKMHVLTKVKAKLFKEGKIKRRAPRSHSIHR